MFARFAADRDLRTREELIERFLPLARSLALRYQRSSEPLEDLVQVASLALIKAIDRFDPTRGCAFSSYAVPTITGELKRHFRDRTWTVRPPRDLQELILRLEHRDMRLTEQLDRAPRASELAAAIGTSEQRLLEALRARAARTGLPLQTLEGRDDDRPTPERFVGSDDEGYERAEARAVLDGLLVALAPRSRTVLRLRFVEDMTQMQIAAQIGVSQMQVSRILREAIEQLRFFAGERARLSGHHPVSRP